MRVGKLRCRQSENNLSLLLETNSWDCTDHTDFVWYHIFPLQLKNGIVHTEIKVKDQTLETVEGLFECKQTNSPHHWNHSYDSLHTHNCLPPLLACCCYELSCDSSPSQIHRSSGAMQVCKYVGPNGLTRQIKVYRFDQEKQNS